MVTIATQPSPVPDSHRPRRQRGIDAEMQFLPTITADCGQKEDGGWGKEDSFKIPRSGWISMATHMLVVVNSKSGSIGTENVTRSTPPKLNFSPVGSGRDTVESRRYFQTLRG